MRFERICGVWAIAMVAALGFLVAPAAAQWRSYGGYQAAPPPPPPGEPDNSGDPSDQDPQATAAPDPRGAYANSQPQAAPPNPFNQGPWTTNPPRPGNYSYAPVSRSSTESVYNPPPDDAQAAATARTRQVVNYPTSEPPGTVVVDTTSRHLYLVQGGGRAIAYGIGVGRDGFAWKGTAQVHSKQEWPKWFPPSDMLQRRPDLPNEMDGGLGNPLGARALYLYSGGKDTLYRIHGTNEPDSIGKAVSSGCIRMMNGDVMDLYERVPVGTRVVVL